MRGGLTPGDALDALPSPQPAGGMRARLGQLEAVDAIGPALAGLRRPDGPAAVPAALDALVDAALTRYGAWAHANPVMLVHGATAPRAVALVLPSLPPALWPASWEAAWAVSAAVALAYRPSAAQSLPGAELDVEDVVEAAVRCGDEHALKLTEVAVESHRRGSAAALPAAARGVALITEE